MAELKLKDVSLEDATLMVEVLEELRSAESKHPNWPLDLFRMDAIVNEEKGELTRAIVLYDMEDGDFQEIRKEGIQLAAMAIRFLKEIRRVRI